MHAALSTKLQQALDGDRVALERLLASRQDRLLARVERKLPPTLRSFVSAEDVVQEVYVEVFRRFDTLNLRHLPGFLRWLVTVADNRLIDCIRMQQAAKRGGGRERAGTDSATDTLLELVGTVSRTPSRSAAAHENAQLLAAAVDRLRPDYRDVLRLRFLEGLSVAEVAARTQRSEYAVQKLSSRGLASLRKLIGDPARFFSSG